MKKHLLPSSATDFERYLEQLTADRLENVLDKNKSGEVFPLDENGQKQESISQLWNPDSCPKELLPWLAWALSVDHWESEWPEENKRQAIKDSIYVHQRKGTRSAIERVLGALKIRVEMQEWYEYDGEPHTFKLTALANEAFQNDVINNSEFQSPEVEGADGDAEILDSRLEPYLNQKFFTDVMRAIDGVKPARSRYELRLGANYAGGLGVAGHIRGGSYMLNRIESTGQKIDTQGHIALAGTQYASSFMRERAENSSQTLTLNNALGYTGTAQGVSIIKARMEVK